MAIKEQQSRTDNVFCSPGQKTDKIQSPIIRKIDHEWTINSLFGKRHWAYQWVTSLCKSDPKFLLHIIQQPSCYVHFLCLVRIALLENPVGGSDEAEYAKMIRTESKEKIMARFHPSYSDDLIRLLPKFGRKPFSQAAYRQIARLLSDDNVRKILANTRRVRGFSLRAFVELPEEFQIVAAVNCIRDEDDKEKFMLFMVTMKHLGINMTKDELNHATKNIKNMRKLLDWLKEKLYSVPFPAPPWDGNGWIKPICSSKELQEIECKYDLGISLTDHLPSILFGYRYYYVCERERVVVVLEKDAVFSWEMLNTIEQYASEEIDPTRKREIIDTFSEAGFGLKSKQSGLFQNDSYAAFHYMDRCTMSGMYDPCAMTGWYA